jgi:hypothetical protein
MRTACAHLGPPLLGTNKAPGRMPPQPLVRPARGAHRFLGWGMHKFARSTRTAKHSLQPSAPNIAGLHSWHAASGAQKGLSRYWAGRLVGAEERSKEVGTRSVLRHLTHRSCLTGADFRPRREFSDATSLRAPQGSPAIGGTTNIEAPTNTDSVRAPRCNDKALKHRRKSRKKATPEWRQAQGTIKPWPPRVLSPLAISPAISG